jgi:uncharacterized iron-regulated membrane protein
MRSMCVRHASGELHVRSAWLRIHRWLGLTIALFVVMAGLTGAVIAFNEELDARLNPDLFHVHPRDVSLSPLALRELAEQLEPRAHVDFVGLNRKPHETAIQYLSARTDPATGAPHELEHDQLFLDPYSGELRGGRQSEGDWGLDRRRLMPTLFWLHRTLLIPGHLGEQILGGVALIWLISAVAGLYLTLPERRGNFLRSWRRSWQVRSVRPLARASFELHRALGLWAWIVILLIALSAVRMNLYEEVFKPVAGAVLRFQEVGSTASRHPENRQDFRWEDALAQGRALMAARAARDGFRIRHESYLALDREQGVFTYAVNSSLDVRAHGGDTQVLFAAWGGRELSFAHPQGSSGNGLAIWLEALHRAHVWGLPHQIFMSLMGLVVVLVTSAGVVLWAKRRGARRTP